MSCGRVALDRAGIQYDKYFASEIDKYAIQITNKNYPNTIQLGDINNWQTWNLPDSIDLLIGGSPCQGFSFAGKQLNFNDERSKLFFKFVDILHYYKPKYFLLENVKMKKEYQDVISQALGVEPIEINSALVSAQNRKRLYWTNIPNIKQPEDNGILLKDIIESGVVDRGKSYCIDANYYKGVPSIEHYKEYALRQIVYCKDKSQTIPATYYKENVKSMIKRNKKVLYVPCVFTERRTEEAKQLRKEYQQKYKKDFSPRRAKELVPREDNKCNCLTGTLTKEHILLDETLSFRKLTPIECERLQTLPDNYTEGVSNTQRYKMLGNGWTVDVVAHIFRSIK
jgi:DNA-cytosine methyltransferase